MATSVELHPGIDKIPLPERVSDFEKISKHLLTHTSGLTEEEHAQIITWVNLTIIYYHAQTQDFKDSTRDKVDKIRKTLSGNDGSAVKKITSQLGWSEQYLFRPEITSEIGVKPYAKPQQQSRNGHSHLLSLLDLLPRNEES